jgi:hypothetical protein
MPLIQGNVPIDVLLRLVAQAVGPLQNSHPLSISDRSGSPQFIQALDDLRSLQAAGVLRVRVKRNKGDEPRLFLYFDTRFAPATEAVAARVCRLLVIDCKSELEFVYGDYIQQLGRNKIPVLMRSLLDVLGAVAGEIQVPEEDVRDGATIATRERENRQPIIVIRMGPTKPTASYVAAQIDGKWCWIERTDFRSKVAFTILEILKLVAESPSAIAPPVLTIPTS